MTYGRLTTYWNTILTSDHPVNRMVAIEHLVRALEEMQINEAYKARELGWPWQRLGEELEMTGEGARRRFTSGKAALEHAERNQEELRAKAAQLLQEWEAEQAKQRGGDE